jgi:uncharacterized protein YceK
MVGIIILLILLGSGCQTVQKKTDCDNARCMPEEHDVRYWRD